jgi:hypothetical protein
MAQEVVCEMLNYLWLVVAALVLGTFGGLITEFIGQARWFSVCVGLITAGVTFGLGTAKTTLEIKDKWLDIRRKKQDDEKSKAKILAPTEEEIRVYGGVSYRQVTRTAHLIVTQQERPLPRDFIVGVTEEKSREESR